METSKFGGGLAEYLAEFGRAKRRRKEMKYTASSLVQRGSKWHGQLQYKDEAGKWRKREKTLASKSKREAQRELDAWRAEMEEQAAREAGAPCESETVSDYLNRYIEGRSASVEPSTIAGYKRALKNQIAPYIGAQSLDGLTPDMVQAWVNEVSKKYAPVVVRKAFTLLRSAMKQAVERDRLLKNPTRTVKPPKLPTPKPNALDERARATVMAVLDVPSPSPSMLGVKIALYTGMREGEICGLRWKSVDVETGRLMVSETIGNDDGRYYVKEPKTGGSRRTIYYPEELAESLRERMRTMERECFAARVPFTGELYVLGGADGSFLSPHYLSRKWRKLADALELVGTEGKRPSFHDLRHTYATTAIAHGIDVKTVSSSMGHANAAMTLNTYATADPDAKRRAAKAMAAAYAADAKRGRGENVVRLSTTGTEG